MAEVERLQVSLELDLATWEASISKVESATQGLISQLGGVSTEVSAQATEAASAAAQGTDQAVQAATQASQKMSQATQGMQKAVETASSGIEQATTSASTAVEGLSLEGMEQVAQEATQGVQQAMDGYLDALETAATGSQGAAAQMTTPVQEALNQYLDALEDTASRTDISAEQMNVAFASTVDAMKATADEAGAALDPIGDSLEDASKDATKATSSMADGIEKEMKPIEQTAKQTGESMGSEFGKAANTVERETRGMGSAVSKEMKPIEQSAKTANDKVEREFARGFAKANSNVQAEMGKMSGTVESAMSGMTGLIGKALAGIGIGKMISSSIDMAADLEETQNVVDVAFGEMAYKANNFAATAIEAYGMSETAAKEVASTHMAMAKGMDLPIEAASDMSVELTKLAGDMASFFNTTTDVTDTALRSVWTGETETLKKYGVVMTQANLSAYAMKQGISGNIAEMDQASAAALRYSYVMDTLGYVQDDFANNSTSWANQTRILSEQFRQLGTIVGGWLVKAFSPIVQVLNTVISKVISFAQVLNSVFAKQFGWDMGGGASTGGSSAPTADPTPATNPKADAAYQKALEKQAKAREKHDAANKKATERYEQQKVKAEERYAKAKKSAEDKAAKAAEKTAKANEKSKKKMEEARGVLASFDQLNILDKPEQADPLADMMDSMSGYEMPEITMDEIEPPDLQPFVDDLDYAAFQGAQVGDILGGFDFPAYALELDPSIDDDKIMSLIDKVKSAGQSIKDWWTGNFGDIWTDFVDKAGVNLENTKAIFQGVWEDLKTLASPLEDWVNDELVEYMRSQFSLISTVVNGVWDSFNQIFSAIWEEVLFPFIDGLVTTWLPLLSEVGAAINGVLEYAYEAFKGVYDRVALEIIVPLLGFLVEEWNKLGEWLTTQWAEHGEQIIADLKTEIDEFEAFANRVVDDIVALGSPLKEWWDDSFVPLLQTTLESAWNIFWDLHDQVTKVMEDLWDIVIYPFATTIAEDWLPILTEALDELIQTFTTLYDEVSDIFDWIWEDVIKPILDLIISAWEDFSTDMKDAWDEHGAPIFEGIREAIEGVGETLTHIWETYIKPVWDKVIAKIKEVWDDSIRPFVRDFANGIGEIARVLLNFWNTKAKPVMDKLIAIFGPAFKAVFETVGGVITNLWNTISSVFQAIRRIFNGIVTFIKGVFSGDWSQAWEGVKEIFGGVWDLIEGIVSGVWDNILGLFENGGKIFKGIAEGIATIFKKIVNSIIGGINKVLKAPFEFINGILNKIREKSILGAQPFKLMWKQDPLPVPQIPSLDVGTNYVQRSGLAMIHEGEAVVPKKYNPAHGGSQEQVQLLQEQNNLLRKLLDKDTDVYLDDKNMTDKQARNARRLQLARGGA